MYLKQINILGFIISFSLLFCHVALSQDGNNTKSKANGTQEEIFIPFTRGIKVGVDVFKPVGELLDDKKLSYEFVVDWNIYTNFFLSVKAGYQDRDFKNEKISTSAQGGFFKAGVYYNFLDRKLGKNDVFYIGGHYGFSILSQSMSHILKDKNSKNTLKQDIPRTQYVPHWLSVSLGINIEVLPFVFFGWEATVSNIIVGRYVEGIDVIHLPGVGEHNDGVGFTFIYTVSFFIPFEAI